MTLRIQPGLPPQAQPAEGPVRATPGNSAPAAAPPEVVDAFVPAAAAARFDPAANVLPAMAGLDPASYRMADGSKLPYLQPSERKAVRDAVAQNTPAGLAVAKKLSDDGMGPMWVDYIRQLADRFGMARARATLGVLNSVLDVNASAWSQQKKYYGEPRPYESPNVRGDSYPSGHAATAYAAATVLATAWPERTNEFFRAAANVARSRVYLGLHFPGDVAAGARLGVAVARKAMG